MSGIFKGYSIYNNGGNGGGYVDGGTLTDAEFIKVENNTISRYTNNSRSEINFYFENVDGIINAIVEISNNNNAVVNVFIKQDEFYYPLGNIGPNSVSSGHNYNVNIIGNSFEVEDVENITNDPSYMYMPETATTLEGVYSVKTLPNGTIWSDYIKFKDSFQKVYQNLYVGKNYIDDMIAPWVANGWRLPNNADIQYLVNNYTGAELLTGGSSGLKFQLLGDYWLNYGTYIPENIGSKSEQWVASNPECFVVTSAGISGEVPVSGTFCPIRLVINV